MCRDQWLQRHGQAAAAVGELAASLGAADRDSAQAAAELHGPLEDEGGHSEYVRGLQEVARQSAEEPGEYQRRLEGLHSEVVCH